jgi:hypothetical protein
MKGRGQVYSNEEHFTLPLLISNQILYHVFSINRNPNLIIFFLNFSEVNIYSFMTFFICNSISWMLFIPFILFLISTT